MRPSTLAELADRAGITVPEIRGYGSFTAFADTYLAACQVLQTRDDFERLVYEVVEDSVLDGAVWVEPSLLDPVTVVEWSESSLSTLFSTVARYLP